MENKIKGCKPEDINIALDLLKKAAMWLRDKKIDYWQDWHNPPAVYVDWIKSGFEKGEFYFVYNSENILLGMYRLQYADEIFWGKRDDKSGYIHSFTTNRDFKGKHIGYSILRGIEKELSEKNIDYLRLDCPPNVKELCKYYENYGFQPRENVVVHGENLRLYEKKINI